MPSQLTLEEYLSPKMFPLTTQAGLTPSQQLLIDAYNFDEMAEALTMGAILTPEKESVLNELRVKHASRGHVLAQIAKQKSAAANPVPGNPPSNPPERPPSGGG